MKQEHGVHRLAYRVISTEREGDIRDAARNVTVWTVFGDVFARMDKVERVVIVLFDTCRNSEDIWVENDVFWWEANDVG